MKVASGSQMELDDPMKLVLCFQASKFHPMKAENPHAFVQLLVLIFTFLLYKLLIQGFLPLLGLLYEATNSLLHANVAGFVVLMQHPLLCAEQAKN